MIINVRSLTGAATALLSGILAAVALTNPARMSWPTGEPQSTVDRWVCSQSTSVVVGAVCAVAVCLYLQHCGSRRRAWMVAATGVSTLLLIRCVVPAELGLELLRILGFVKTIAAGLILGGAAAASWDSLVDRGMLLAGTVTAWLAAQSFVGPRTAVSTSAIGEPAWILLVLTLIFVTKSASAAHAEPGHTEPAHTESHTDGVEPRTAATAMAVVCALAATQLVLSSVIDRQSAPSTNSTWTVMIVCTLAVLALTWAGSKAIHDGGFLWAATAVAAAAAPVFAELTRLHNSDSPRTSSWIIVVIAITAVAVGLIRARGRRIIALALLGAAALSELFFDSNGIGPQLLVQIVALGLGAGLLLGSTEPTSAASATLGMIIPFTCMVFVSVQQHNDERSVVSAQYLVDDAPVESEPILWERRDSGTPDPETIAVSFEEPTRTVGGAALMCGVIATASIALHRRNNTAPTTTPSPD